MEQNRKLRNRPTYTRSVNFQQKAKDIETDQWKKMKGTDLPIYSPLILGKDTKAVQ